jgi:glycogen(starch) synthase
MLGKPIIACNAGGNPEIITNQVNGLLIPPKDEEALYHAMSQLTTGGDIRNRFGAAARQTFTEAFNFERIVRESFLPLYEKN